MIELPTDNTIHFSADALTAIIPLMNSEGGRKVVAQWYRLAMNLCPKARGAQYVAATTSNAKALIAAGLLKRAQTRYYVPRAIAFASTLPRPQPVLCPISLSMKALLGRQKAGLGH